MSPLRLILLSLAALIVGPPATAQNVQDVPDPDPMLELEQLDVAEGFEINLFASDPMITKPVRMAWDEMGRLWVVGTTSYPQIVPGQEVNDRIVVLEDTDRDGRADTSIVFAEGLQMPTGIAVGDGGVYVGSSDELLHLKDTDGDGRADERRVLFRGFGQDDTHHLINTFRWSPGGQLYFNQGIYAYSSIETPWGPRRLYGGGIWRLQPETLRLEVYTRGMINPWGHEFDEWGQSFATDGADYEGIYYAFPGAQFSAAVGAERTITGLNAGHPKYAGLEILSGRHLPDSLQGHFLTNDFRANRIIRFVVSEEGSGYRSEEAGAFVSTDHIAFRPVDIRMGPDGAIYVADWYNPIIQHGEIDFRDPRRDQQHGRIWRITAKGRPLVDLPDLAGATTMELLDALKLPEAWARRQARRLLRERGAHEVAPVLDEWVGRLDTADEEYDRLLLEVLWVSQSVDVVNQNLLTRVLEAEDPRARAAAVRVLYYWNDRVQDVDEMLTRAVHDEHPRVRLEAVTALRQRHRAEAARTALEVLEKPVDRFLDYALWKTLHDLEPIWLDRLKASPDYFGEGKKLVYALKVSDEPYAIARLTRLFDRGEVPEEYRQDVLDAIAIHGTPAELQILFERALTSVEGGDVEAGQGAIADSVSERLDLLSALERAAQQGGEGEDDGEVDGDRRRRPVEGLDRIAPLLHHEDDDVAASAARLVGYWDLTAFRENLVEIAEAPETSDAVREASVAALTTMGDSLSTRALIHMTRPDRPSELRILAAAALPRVDLRAAAETAVELLDDLSAEADASRVFRALLSHDDGPGALVAALEDREISAPAARAGLEVIRSRGSRWLSSNEDAGRLQTALEAIGGPLPPPRIPQNPSPPQLDRLELNVKAEGDASKGELIYRRPELACQTCHAIAGAGGSAGPDLSSLGASAPVDYIIESVLMPDKAVKDGFSLVNVTRTDGTVVSGLLVRETGAEIVLRDLADQEVSIPVSQVRERAVVPGSLMPAGLTAQLEESEFLDLIRFMSELGESDEFTPQHGWIRRWRAAAANDAAENALAATGPEVFASGTGEELTWQPLYSKVSGELALEDMPVIMRQDGADVSAVRFELEVRRAGSVDLGLGAVKGVSLWVGAEGVSPLRDRVSLDLPEGTHRITVVVDRDVREAPLAIEVLESSTAQVQPVLGK